MYNGGKITIEQCHTIIIKLDKIGKSQSLYNHATFESRKLKNLVIDLAP